MKWPPEDSFDSTDPINGFDYLSEAYAATDPNFDGRVTVPVLWDKETKKIVNNCEDDVCRMFNDAFNTVAQSRLVDLFPKEIEADRSFPERDRSRAQQALRFSLREREQWRL